MVCSTKDGELFPPLFLMLFSWYCVLNLPHSRLGLSLSLFFFKFIWAALGLSCSTKDLHCLMRDLSTWHADSSWGTLAPEHVGFSSYGEKARFLHGTWDLRSPTRDRTRIPYFARWMLNHWTTREVPCMSLTRPQPHSALSMTCLEFFLGLSFSLSSGTTSLNSSIRDTGALE